MTAMASSLLSIMTKRRFNCCATAPVVTEPAKKSRTQSFPFDEALRIRRRTPSGFCVV